MTASRTLDLASHHIEYATLNLNNLDLTDDELIGQVIPYLLAHPDIELVTANNNKLSDKSAAALAREISTVQYLMLEENKIGFIGGIALSRNKSYKTLNLNYNNIQDTGFVAFKGHPTLVSLHVAGNHITNAGVEKYTENSNAYMLNLEDNNIDDTAAFALTRISSLQKIYIAGTKLTNAGFLTLTENRALHILSLDANIAIPPVRSLKELTVAMSLLSPENCGEIWQLFTLQALQGFLLNGQHHTKKIFNTALQNQSLYAGDEYHAKRILLGFLVLYMKSLEVRSTDNDWTIGRLVGNPTKQTKQPAAEFLYELLTSDLSLQEIDEKLAEKTEHAAAFNDTNLKGWIVSKLAALRAQITVVKEPDYRKVETVQVRPK